MSDNKKLVLCIDASAPCSAVAVGRLDTVDPLQGSEFLAGDERVDGANQASQTLGQRIEDALAEADVEMSQVEFIACGCGPGTFCLLYTSPSPRDQRGSRMPSSA